MPGAFVQAATTFIAGGGPGTLALGSAVTAGNTLVLFLFDTSNTGGAFTISDNRNGSWPAVLGSFNDASFGGTYAVAAKGSAAAGATTVTVSEASGHSFQIVLAEVSGVVATADGFKGAGVTSGSGADGLVVGSLTNSAQPAMLLAACQDTGSSTTLPTAGTGFTRDFAAANNGTIATTALEHKRLTTTGSQSSTFGAVNGDYYACVAVAFDETGGGGGLAAVPPLNEAGARRASPRPPVAGAEAPPPLLRQGAGISVSAPERRRDARPTSFGGDAVEPGVVRGAGIDTSPPLVRQPPRALPPSGAVAAVVLAPPVLGPLAEASPPVRRRSVPPGPASGEATPPLIARGAGIDAAPAAWRRAPRPFDPGGSPVPGPAAAGPHVAVEATSAQRRPDRAQLPTVTLPLGPLPPQTVVVAVAPTGPTGALGMAFTTVAGTAAPTGARST